MKTLNFASIDKQQAKYLQLATAIRNAIRDGQLAPDEKLPSVKQFSDSLHFNRHTIMKALSELVAEGWLISEQRKGYKVVADLPIESSIKNSPELEESQSFNFRLVSRGTAVPEHTANHYPYNFSGGQPDLSLFPYQEFKRHMGAVLNHPDVQQLGYGHSAGDPSLIEQIKIYLRRVRALTNKEIVITNGSQEALFIISQLLLKQDDKVAVEQLGYPPAWSAFRSAGASLLGVKQDEHGIVPEHLELLLKQHKIRLLYLTPLHQYPTGVTLTVSRRMKIYQLAETYGVPIIEDDYNHEFHYRCHPLAPMASQDPCGLVIYLSTFSKIMFPGARIGFLAVDKKLAQAISEYRLLICHKSNSLMQAALAKWMESGGFERHLRRSTRIYQQRRDHAVELLNRLEQFEFSAPDGGMALWLKCTKSFGGVEKLTAKAKTKGIYIQQQGEYQLTPEQNTDDHLRLGYAGLDENSFSEGINSLIKLM